jgi:RyR domain
MAATSTYPRSLHRWNVASGVLLALYVLNLAVFAVSVYNERLVRAIGLGAYTDERAWWPILVQVALGAAAFVTYYWPRRREARNFSVLVTGVLVATTIPMGLVAYWNCPSTANESTFWTPLTFAINLIFGGVQGCYVGPDAQPLPLALQLPRLTGPLLLVIAAFGIMASIFRSQTDRLLVRFSGSLVVLVGLADDAMPLIRRLITQREADTTLAVLVADPGNLLIKSARSLGARVVVCDVDNRGALLSLLTARGRFKVRSLYAVAADVAENLRWAAQLRAVADASKRSPTDRAPRMVVRIDDPWQAEYWRRTNAYRTSGSGSSVRWISDALSVYEVTAELILDRILDPRLERPFDRLVIIGNSPLALAACTELAQREREGDALSATPRPGLADLILYGAEADTLRRQHRLRQERFGNSGDIGLISVIESEPTSANLRAALQDDQHPALILADDPTRSETRLATYLAALNPTWTIFDWSPNTRGVADQPIMELLYPFGLTMEAPSSLPVDSWERAARVVHEQYRLTAQQHQQLDASKPSHQPWDQLEPFLRESNIRQVTTALAAAESLGRSWGPVVRGVTSDGLVASAEVSASELDTMARIEHESWMKHLHNNGWRYGAQRDDRHRIHPSLRAWDDLTAVDQQKTREGVANALRVLNQLGYRSTVLRPESERLDKDNGSDWAEVTRRGEVTAVRSNTSWTWTSESGATMRGAVGDWRVSNDSGRSWSVAPEIFASTYEHVAGNRWRRTGRAWARRAVPGEVIKSLEGRQTAVEGDWVIRGSQGEEWVTTSEHFAASYEISEPSNRL